MYRLSITRTDEKNAETGTEDYETAGTAWGAALYDLKVCQYDKGVLATLSKYEILDSVVVDSASSNRSYRVTVEKL